MYAAAAIGNVSDRGGTGHWVLLGAADEDAAALVVVIVAENIVDEGEIEIQLAGCSSWKSPALSSTTT